MPFIWSVRGGKGKDSKYLQLFKGGIFYPLREEIAEEIMSKTSPHEVSPPEDVPQFSFAKEIKVHEVEGDSPELVMHPSRTGGEITYAIRFSSGGTSISISPHFAYGLKYTNRLELVDVGKVATKKEAGKAMVYRLLPMEPSCIDEDSGRICSYML